MNRIALATLLLLFFATAAHAQISNGDFSAGLGGWIPTQTDEVTTSGAGADATGSPGGVALIFGNGGFLTEPEGSGSISQTFDCGEAGTQANCVISFQYQRVLSGGVTVRLDAIVDGGVEFTTVLSGTSAVWTDVSFAVPCGTHNLRLQATYLDGGFSDEWRVFLDNVTAECESPVANDEMEWGTFKATYQ
jgi:hypothetical protein